MRRDLELVRKMLLACEDSPTGWVPDFNIEGYTEAQIGYHAYLMMDAGLVNGSDVTTNGSQGPEAMITSLTWQGHEFAEAARDSGRWSKAVGLVAEKSGSITLDVMKQLLISIMKGQLGLP